MEQYEGQKSAGVLDWITSSIGRVLIALFIPAITFIILWRVFIFLRDSDAPQAVIAIVAIIWGVGGVAANVSTFCFLSFFWCLRSLARSL